ncbi:MAG TPA: RNA 2'-phosphotransferase [Ardenticatenaceae bacterium]
MDYRKLSKAVAHALRHAPEQYGITLDEEGWTPVEALLAGLRRRRREWRDLSARDLEEMNAWANKQRFEFAEGSIRALYGHSLQARIQKREAEPPPTLYHGTAPDAARLILREGLKPMRRQYVHLSATVEMAREVGRRKAAQPVILTVRAAEAHLAGITFYEEANGVWLADAVPPNYIERIQN